MTLITTDCTIGVVGAGTMGAGIAQLAAAAGHPVVLFDAFEGAAEKGKAGVARGLEKLVARGKMDEATRISLVDRIQVADSLSDMADAALVVEAIVEKLEIKQQLFADLEKIVSSDTILATNTSSISVTSIARTLAHPERVVGMHFFNPAPIMKLVEVISGIATSKACAERVFATAEAWGKIAVHAKSTPGFIVNRVARPYYAEALRLCEEQVAQPATIDAILTEGAGFRMGAFELMDLIGNDVNYTVCCSVFDAYYQEPRFRPSILQLEMVNAGRLGRKAGQGFYSYADGAEKPTAVQLESVDAAAISEFDLAQGGNHNGVDLLPSSGETAARLARASGRPTLVYDYADTETTKRLAFAVSATVPRAVIDSFAATLQQQGIAAVELPDWPGLVVMRTLATLANEGFEAVMQGVSDESGVDKAMRFGVNYPKGPISWAREIGLGRILSTLESIHALTGDPRYRASMALRFAAEAI